jgi:hypothetical protein
MRSIDGFVANTEADLARLNRQARECLVLQPTGS